MSEKYYVVSESELEDLVNKAREFEYANSRHQSGGRQPFKRAEAACREREVKLQDLGLAHGVQWMPVYGEEDV